MFWRRESHGTNLPDKESSPVALHTFLAQEKTV